MKKPHADRFDGELITQDRISGKITLRLIPSMFAIYGTSYPDRINAGFRALKMNAHFGFGPVPIVPN